MPFGPIAWYAYELKGPGNPFKESTNRPESSTATTPECRLDSSSEAKLAISTISSL